MKNLTYVENDDAKGFDSQKTEDLPPRNKSKNKSKNLTETRASQEPDIKNINKLND